MRWQSRGLAAWGVVACAACAGTPSVGGVAGVSPSPSTAWSPPPEERNPEQEPRTPIPADLQGRIQRLTLAEVVDLGLRNNPSTRLSWANARAAAAAYGVERGAYFPTVNGDVVATRLKTVASQGRSAVTQSVLNPSLSLSYLLFDFGGRSGNVGSARNELVAANFTHNATLQRVVLQIQAAYFQYVANRGLLEAQRTTEREAGANLNAAEERNRVGVATIADVLQARTAASQAVVGGLLFSQITTLYITPVVYTYLDAWQKRLSRRRTAVSREYSDSTTGDPRPVEAVG